MYALQEEPESGRRGRTLALASGLVVAAQIGLLTVTARIERPPPVRATDRARLRIVSQGPPPPPPPLSKTPEPSPPPVKPPMPTAKTKRPRPAPLEAPIAPRPMPSENTQPTPAAAAPLVVGLTLSSTTRSGKGPRFGVGNTLMGTPDRVASEPRSAPMARAPLEPRSLASSEPAPFAKSRVDAKLLESRPPFYPPQARRDGIEGVVVLTITINRRGVVEKARVLRGLESSLDASALQAAKATRWEPATVGGRPVRITRRFNVRFTLQS